jgi:hypothetical protein
MDTWRIYNFNAGVLEGYKVFHEAFFNALVYLLYYTHVFFTTLALKIAGLGLGLFN